MWRELESALQGFSASHSPQSQLNSVLPAFREGARTLPRHVGPAVRTCCRHEEGHATGETRLAPQVLLSSEKGRPALLMM